MKIYGRAQEAATLIKAAKRGASPTGRSLQRYESARQTPRRHCPQTVPNYSNLAIILPA